MRNGIDESHQFFVPLLQGLLSEFSLRVIQDNSVPQGAPILQSFRLGIGKPPAQPLSWKHDPKFAVKRVKRAGRFGDLLQDAITVFRVQPPEDRGRILAHILRGDFVNGIHPVCGEWKAGASIRECAILVDHTRNLCGKLQDHFMAFLECPLGLPAIRNIVDD
ncbi:hypothetical protein SDC9_182741 [bioreactor metagenome]|uniref:Uncharacterized protein n=1 Tax=bioreactor metagenome TaxID=1076179 RepID=A0A645HGJ3_9ZZZZ